MTDVPGEAETHEAAGWAAIEAALAPLYGDREPLRHFAAVPHYDAGGDDPIDGISVYAVEDPRPHWHYVTYGFSELRRKLFEDPDVSGWGFELSLRLACETGAVDPPDWPPKFLRRSTFACRQRERDAS